MKKDLLKNQNGFIGTDTYIAVIIAVLSSVLITVLIYNIYIVSSKAKRDSQATSYIVEVFEHIDKELYGEVTEENLVNYINDKYNNGTEQIASARNTTGLSDTEDTKTILTTPYKFEISITPYSEEFDLVKTINVTIKYNVGFKEESVSMQKVKARENLITPNKPLISDINISGDTYCYPVKLVNNNWQVTNENDTTWYNYQNKQWATIFISSDELSENDVITSTINGYYKIWIPKYAYSNIDNSDIVFIYQDTNCYVENGDLEIINENEYTIANEGWIRYR